MLSLSSSSPKSIVTNIDKDKSIKDGTVSVTLSPSNRVIHTPFPNPDSNNTEKNIKPFDESALKLTESTTLKSSTLASPEKESTIFRTFLRKNTHYAL